MELNSYKQFCNIELSCYKKVSKLTVILKVSGHEDGVASVDTVGAIVVNVSKSSLK
jgi:hypothetical protein